MSTPVSDLDDFLECSICLDTFDEPKILPCTHRFCRGCLQKEIERFDTSNPHASFHCPQCRGLVLLKKLDRGEEFVDQLQTDRLLRNIIESLKEDPDVCASHRMRREVVCYSCQETGCLRCAWNRHRSCSKTGDYQQEVLRIETLLNESLAETQKTLECIDAYVKTWTNAMKSFKNQLEYSSVFFEKYLEEKRALFLSSVNGIRSKWDSFSKSHLCSSSTTNNLLNQRMEELFDKLKIGIKFEHAEHKCEEILKVLRKQELDASTRLTNTPDKNVLEDIGNGISEVLKLEKSVMVVRGEKILTDNKEILSKGIQRQLRTDTSNTPSSYLLVGLITQEQQIAFDLKDEEELVEKLLLLLEAADNHEGLLSKLNEVSGHACPLPDKTGRESYFTIVSSILFQLICHICAIVKDSLSSLAHKDYSLSDVFTNDASVFEEIEISFAARHRKRRRRRNAVIDYIPTTESYFQLKRPVIIARRSTIK